MERLVLLVVLSPVYLFTHDCIYKVSLVHYLGFLILLLVGLIWNNPMPLFLVQKFYMWIFQDVLAFVAFFIWVSCRQGLNTMYYYNNDSNNPTVALSLTSVSLFSTNPNLDIFYDHRFIFLLREE